MSGYRHVSHTADVIVEAWGVTLTEAFSAFTDGFGAVLSEEKTGEGSVSFVQCESSSLDLLLFDYATELVFLQDTQKLLPRSFHGTIEKTTSGWSLNGTVTGERFTQVHGHIKSATLSGLRAESSASETRLRCTLDL